jgi:hypothetical protein
LYPWEVPWLPSFLLTFPEQERGQRHLEGAPKLRGHLTTLAALLVIAVCVLILFARIEHAYHGPVLPDSWTPPPLVPTDTAEPTPSTSAATPASTRLGPGSPLPTGTVTTWVTVTASPR